jgi:hypothetical protein
VLYPNERVELWRFFVSERNRFLGSNTLATTLVSLTGDWSSFSLRNVQPALLAGLAAVTQQDPSGVFFPEGASGAADMVLVLPSGDTVMVQCKLSMPTQAASCRRLQTALLAQVAASNREQADRPFLATVVLSTKLISDRAEIPSDMGVVTRRGLRQFFGYSAAEAFFGMSTCFSSVPCYFCRVCTIEVSLAALV